MRTGHTYDRALTIEARMEIAARYHAAKGTLSMDALAAEYNVSRNTIWRCIEKYPPPTDTPLEAAVRALLAGGLVIGRQVIVPVELFEALKEAAQ